MKATMYKQGSGWIISSWSDKYGAYRLSDAMPYGQARFFVGLYNCPAERGGKCRNKDHYHGKEATK